MVVRHRPGTSEPLSLTNIVGLLRHVPLSFSLSCKPTILQFNSWNNCR